MAQGGSAVYVPPVSERAWRSFWEMDASRRYDYFAGAAHPINHQDIAAFQDVSGFRLRSWERRAILAMERARLSWLNRSSEQREAGKVASLRPMTPDLFDALFR